MTSKGPRSLNKDPLGYPELGSVNFHQNFPTFCWKMENYEQRIHNNILSKIINHNLTMTILCK